MAAVAAVLVYCAAVESMLLIVFVAACSVPEVDLRADEGCRSFAVVFYLFLFCFFGNI